MTNVQHIVISDKHFRLSLYELPSKELYETSICQRYSGSNKAFELFHHLTIRFYSRAHYILSNIPSQTICDR
jgi:hypothetical protein